MPASWGNATTEEYVPQSRLVDESRYSAVIDKVELKTGGDSGKRYINLHFKIESGNNEGRFVFHAVFVSSDYLKHDNQEWVQQQINHLKRIFLISGQPVPTELPTPTQLQTLKDTHYDIEVVIEESKKYGDKNKVQEVYPSSLEAQSVNDEVGIDINLEDVPF